MIDPGVWHISHGELTLRIMSALVVGGLVGLEREYGQHSAGFRTHILVCLGSALIMLLSIYGLSMFTSDPNLRADPARLAAQAVSGIGFLGAGTILRNGSTVSGLTTAASLWVVAALGLAVGAGFYYGALLTTILVLVSLFALNKLEGMFSAKRKAVKLTVLMKESSGAVQSIMNKLAPTGATLFDLSAGIEAGLEKDPTLLLQFKMKKTILDNQLEMLSGLRNTPGVLRVKVQAMDAKTDRKKKDGIGAVDVSA